MSTTRKTAPVRVYPPGAVLATGVSPPIGTPPCVAWQCPTCKEILWLEPSSGAPLGTCPSCGQLLGEQRSVLPLPRKKRPKEGTRYTRPDGYVVVWSPSHWSVENSKTKWVLEHRLVMEKKLGRRLVKGEVVHHLNGRKGDNRPANLDLFASNAEHITEELTGATYGIRESERIRWVTFTRRTNDPKLAWLERQLGLARIPHRRNGVSFHAPILEVDEDCLEAAWEILKPVDDIDDSDQRFTQQQSPQTRGDMK